MTGIIRKLNLKSKVLIIMGAFIFIIVVILALIFSGINRNYDERLVGIESVKTLHSIDNSISEVLNSADNYSKMLIADNIINTQMSKGDINSDLGLQTQVINRIYSILQFSETADAIWLIDNRGNKLRVGGVSGLFTAVGLEKYEALKKPYGSAEIFIGNNNGMHNISLVRAYNSTATFESLGIIGVDINTNRIRDIMSSAIDRENEKILLLNEKDEPLFWSGEWEDIASYHGAFNSDEFIKGELAKKKHIAGERYLISGIVNDRGWRIIRFISLPLKNSEDDMFKIVISIIVLAGIFILISTALVVDLLTKPIQAILKAMESNERNIPDKIYEKPFLDEFEILFSGYNNMVERIQRLLGETVERQKRIRQVELNEIQEQMKPHFLYNTLDSIEALAMMGDTGTVCRLIEALGGFYRKSVSGGKEFLTIGEEMGIASDYAEIMHIRFGESFVCNINCDEDCRAYLLPKLTIQPLLENAFQHGIRGKVQYGVINISAALEDNEVHISINDNGAGIPADIVDELVEDRENEVNGSLGLRGTIKRLRLLYNEAFRFTIGMSAASGIDIYIDREALVKEDEQIQGSNY